MTVENLQEKIKEIQGAVDDDERAHSLEDELHHEVLEAIAAGKGDNPRKLALAAIQTRNIKFERWCA